ncbi:tRNA (guanosine(37)-N1)-methyltransferase TrmD [Candidatus Magnetaquicoccus inordinatus]|uniref:tRNA (guanosine(37)-N1)-methyltransferase TrmD n=1 Tax=Candidatus Magnetaquicoccus inordinatus TaxID=2496818 RepID=UPI00102CECEF
MRCSIVTLFPEMFTGLLRQSILKRAQEHGLLEVNLLQLRDFAENRHQRVDDAPFGGGPGMVLKADVLERAVGHLRVAEDPLAPAHVVYLTPQGQPFVQADAKRLAGMAHLILVCGHYEGVDERFVATQVDEELSLGDFVLTGGEIPAMAVLDAVARLLPGVLGDPESFAGDSFYQGLLDHPHYTRPARWQPAAGQTSFSVPEVLLSGHHSKVRDWRRRQALLRTLLRRPDWLIRANLSKTEKALMELLASALEQDEWRLVDGTNCEDQMK